MAGLFLLFIMLIAFATLANGYIVSLNKYTGCQKHCV